MSVPDRVAEPAIDASSGRTDVVLYEVRDSGGKADEAQAGVLADLRLGGAEAGTPEQMLQILFSLWCHGAAAREEGNHT